MKEKVFEWANLWGFKVNDYSETSKFVYFDIEENSITRRNIMSLEEFTGLEFDSVNLNFGSGLQVWLWKGMASF